MTATILLIRHAAHGQLGQALWGRTPGLGLSDEGRRQASCLAERLRTSTIAELHTSPVQRARETAAAIARGNPGLQISTIPALDELDFGEWAGRAFVELEDDPRWGEWNFKRSAAIAPNGESMAEAQSRAWSHIQRVALASPDATIAMVTHCDVIRAVVCKVLDLSLDSVLKFEVDTASITRMVVGTWGSKLLSLNEGSG